MQEATIEGSAVTGAAHRNDRRFVVRKDGAVSQMPIDQVSDELLLALTLRTHYYLQRPQSLELEGSQTCTSPQLRRTLRCPSSNYLGKTVALQRGALPGPSASTKSDSPDNRTGIALGGCRLPNGRGKIVSLLLSTARGLLTMTTVCVVGSGQPQFIGGIKMSKIPDLLNCASGYSFRSPHLRLPEPHGL
jgi:hypothetical protein